MTFSKLIEDKIRQAKLGSVFVISDFTDLANYDTVRKTLSRLENDHKIRKIHRGIYYKQEYSKLLDEPVSPNMNNVAQAIARNYEWTIVPSGENALNMLGISTQVPGRYSYISSGPYRKYTIGNSKIEFNHQNNKDISGKSYQTRLIIQAIKSIGKDRIGDYIPELRKKLSINEKKIILKESQRTTAWIYAAIKDITKEELNECTK